MSDFESDTCTHSYVSPVQISSAGPSSVARAPSIVTTSSPPGIATRTGLSDQPRATAAAATATAEEPDAAVSPCPALPDEDGDDVAWLGTRELDVRPVREARVRLDRRADPQQIVAGQRVPQHDCMRVPDQHGNDGEPLPGDVEHLVGRDDNLVELLSDEPVLGRPGPHEASRRRDLDLVRIRLTKQPRSRDARAVSGHLGVRPVRVPDPELGSSCASRETISSTPSLPIPVRTSQILRARAPESGPAAGCSTST